MNYQELTQAAYSQDSWAIKYKAEIDAKNVLILAERQKGLDAREGIGVGDFVIDGENTQRVAHDWGDFVQLTDGRFGSSFYLGNNGYVDFSGGLNPGISKEQFLPTDERREGPVWFFAEDSVRAHNGYHTQASFRVWRLAP